MHRPAVYARERARARSRGLRGPRGCVRCDHVSLVTLMQRRFIARDYARMEVPRRRRRRRNSPSALSRSVCARETNVHRRYTRSSGFRQGVRWDIELSNRQREAAYNANSPKPLLSRSDRWDRLTRFCVHSPARSSRIYTGILRLLYKESLDILSTFLFRILSQIVL